MLVSEHIRRATAILIFKHTTSGSNDLYVLPVSFVPIWHTMYSRRQQTNFCMLAGWAKQKTIKLTIFKGRPSQTHSISRSTERICRQATGGSVWLDGVGPNACDWRFLGLNSTLGRTVTSSGPLIEALKARQCKSKGIGLVSALVGSKPAVHLSPP